MAHNPNTPPRAPETRSSGSQWFIIGGLVVAVLVIGLVMFGGDADVATDGGVDTTVNVETGAVGTDAQDARPEAQPTAPEAEAATGVPAEGEATVEGGGEIPTQ